MLILDTFNKFDFEQMRSLDGRATADALEKFHQIFHDFFAQYPDKQLINANILQNYVANMEEITKQINESEYKYFLKKYKIKYKDESLATVENMAKSSRLKSYRSIPSRLQFWAASASWGGTVRYPQKHLNTVKQLQNWEKLAEPFRLELKQIGESARLTEEIDQDASQNTVSRKRRLS
jgi:hypothetical protein